MGYYWLAPRPLPNSRLCRYEMRHGTLPRSDHIHIPFVEATTPATKFAVMVYLYESAA